MTLFQRLNTSSEIYSYASTQTKNQKTYPTYKVSINNLIKLDTKNSLDRAIIRSKVYMINATKNNNQLVGIQGPFRCILYGDSKQDYGILNDHLMVYT